MNPSTLKISSVDSIAISFEPHFANASENEAHAWRNILKDLLIWAYLGRPACLITTEPQTWSLGRELTQAEAIVINKVSYLPIFIDTCSKDLLMDVADSEDFRRGLLWLASIPANEKKTFCELIRSVQGSGSAIPKTDKEIILNVGDGYLLWWLNPHRPRHDILLISDQIAKTVGWNVTT